MISLKERISQEKILIVPGAFDAFTGKLVEFTGFEALYLSGAGVSYTMLGQPDTGQITQSQMVEKVRNLAEAVSLPMIADGDTGYGNAINVMRTVRLYENAGASAIQLEDQQFPKRCGHLSGKELISAGEMVEKIKAAQSSREKDDFLIIARTDARTVDGIDEALRRSHLYLDCGADVLFVESPMNEQEMKTIAKEFSGIPLMANMVEGGITPLIEANDLQDMGYSIVIYPNSLTRRFAYAGLELLEKLKSRGSSKDSIKQMMPFNELNEMLGIDDFKLLEEKYLPRPEK